jgi:hypothetical protein
LVLSGSLERRLRQVERLAATPRWVASAGGVDLDIAGPIRALVAAARQHIAARRYQKAVAAWVAAFDHLVHTGRNARTLAEMRGRQAEAERRGRLSASGNEAKKRKATRWGKGLIEKAREFQKRRHEGDEGERVLPLSATIRHLRRVTKRRLPSDATLRRRLHAHGIR